MAAAAVVVLLVLALAVRVGVALLTPVTASQLKAYPEAHLYYPGATLLDVSGTDEYDAWFLGTSRDAVVSSTLASDAQRSAIVAWYDSQLTS